MTHPVASGQTWNRQCLTQHPMFATLMDYGAEFIDGFNEWPSLADYQALLNQIGPPESAGAKPLRFVAQDDKPAAFETQYEPRIYLRGEIQTRLRNWHDFFQVLIWRGYPRIKVALNALHFHALKQRMELHPNTSRSNAENALTLFDECGGIVVSHRQDLLACVQHFQWHRLFWDQRESFERDIKVFVFGHANLEKGLNPYIGLCSHCVLAQVEPAFFSKTEAEQRCELDHILAHMLTTPSMLASPADLSPFPLLGIPGWHAGNHQRAFYDNTQYFRGGRRIKK